MTLDDMLKVVNSGGNFALAISIYYIYKSTVLLARIEKALQKYMESEEQ